MKIIVTTAVLGAMLLSGLLTLLLRRWATRIGFVDKPGGHKEHEKPVALGGGIAIFLSVGVPLLVGVLGAKFLLASGNTDWIPELVQPHLPGIVEKLPTVLAILGGALVLHVLGLIDDIYALGPWLKLFIQLAVAFVLVAVFKIRAAEALGPIPSIAISVLWLGVVINAFNFLDNMDGLSAGVAAIAAAIFAASAMAAGQLFVPVMAWVLVGALLGFLAFNFAPATVFMGDAGSMVVGYFLGVLTILTTYYNPEQQLSPVGVLVPLVVLAVPLYDMCSVVIHRLKAGVSPFRGDRRHFSHRLVNRGMATRSAVLTIYLATAATSLGAIALPSADVRTATIIFVQCICVVLIIAILEHAPQKD